MKKFIVIALCLFLICGAAFYFISLPHNVSEQRAENGVLDITGENFDRTLFNLHGDWEFYFGELVAPESFVDGMQPKGTLINTPMSWDNAGYSLTGCATYRLVLKTDLPELLMYVPEININAMIFINGEKAYEAGRPGMTAAESAIGIGNGFVTVRPQNGEADIVIWVSNYEWMYAGLMQSVLAGEQDVMLRYIVLRLMFLAIFIGMLIMMGFYHLILFFNRRKDRAYLYFSLICLLAAVRFFMETNAFAVLLSATGLGRVHIFSYMSVSVLFVGILGLFTHAALGLPYTKPRRIIYGAAIFVPLLASFILPFTVLGPFYAMISLIPGAMSCVTALRSKPLRQNPYNALYLLAILFFIIWGSITKIVMSDAYFVPGIASNMFLILSQCVLLSISYTEAKRRAEELAAKTDFYRKMSHDLRTPLTIVSTNIQTARRRPEEAGELLTHSQSEIMKMADMISNALKNGEKGAGE